MTTTSQDHIQISEDFLERAETYLVEGDLHQASEKGWGAAAHMAKAAAAAHGWTYETHDDFFNVIREASNRLRDRRLHTWRKSANDLHRNFYVRKMFLDAETIEDDLNDVKLLTDALKRLAAGR